MNILMMTNTYLPHVGGVARSIERFATRYRAVGHHVRVVAPTFDGMPEHEENVVRIPAVRHFNHTDFSVALPIPHRLKSVVDDWEPDIIHSHHPFLVGGIALRIAHTHRLPIVFTHHTRYEDYTHNVPGDSRPVKRFAIRLATNYANHCDRVFAPSKSTANLIRERGVTSPISVVPTGLDPAEFAGGDCRSMRQSLGIPDDAFVVGHLGRLSVEKNINFLVDSMLKFLKLHSERSPVCCVIFGEGHLATDLRARFRNAGFDDQLHIGGVVTKDQLPDAYAAMDVFAFASQSETQGMVLTEAMAAGLPVVALDAPGVREVVEDRVNGCMLLNPRMHLFAEALQWIFEASLERRESLRRAARETAERFSMDTIAWRALELYSRLRQYDIAHRAPDYPVWVDALHVLEGEWMLLENTLRSVSQSLHR